MVRFPAGFQAFEARKVRVAGKEEAVDAVEMVEHYPALLSAHRPRPNAVAPALAVQAGMAEVVETVETVEESPVLRLALHLALRGAAVALAQSAESAVRQGEVEMVERAEECQARELGATPVALAPAGWAVARQAMGERAVQQREAQQEDLQRVLLAPRTLQPGCQARSAAAKAVLEQLPQEHHRARSQQVATAAGLAHPEDSTPLAASGPWARSGRLLRSRDLSSTADKSAQYQGAISPSPGDT